MTTDHSEGESQHIDSDNLQSGKALDQRSNNRLHVDIMTREFVLLSTRTEFLRTTARAMVDELANRNLGSQLGHTTEMITMPMRRDQMIDLRKSGVFGKIHNAPRVARSRRADISGIDE